MDFYAWCAVSTNRAHKALQWTLSKPALDDAEITNLGGSRPLLYELDERPYVGGVNVLAKAASFDAALRLAELFKAAA